MDGQRGKDVSLTSCKVCVVTSRPPGLILEPKERDVQWMRHQCMDLTSQNRKCIRIFQTEEVYPSWPVDGSGDGGGREGGKKERDGGGREDILLMTELISRLIK